MAFHGERCSFGQEEGTTWGYKRGKEIWRKFRRLGKTGVCVISAKAGIHEPSAAGIPLTRPTSPAAELSVGRPLDGHGREGFLHSGNLAKKEARENKQTQQNR
jgi:hypothetical protein